MLKNSSGTHRNNPCSPSNQRPAQLSARRVLLGRSVEKQPIEAFVLPAQQTDTPHTLLVFAGFHGDEPKSVDLARRLLTWLCEKAPDGRHVRWVIVPLVNPDGYALRKRRNANRVDINRNFPTQNWSPSSPRSRMFGGPRPASEPESRAVIAAVRRFRPAAIITIHSIGLNRFCNNYDGPARSLARAMARHNGYPVTASIGYPTPGSFGAWAGNEFGIPTITLELPSHHSIQRCRCDNLSALFAAGMWAARVQVFPAPL